MRCFNHILGGALVGGLLIQGCATTPDVPPPTLTTATQPAWSLYAPRDEIVVAVSAARQTGQLFGTVGTVVGSGISAAADARHKRKVMEALGDYDAGAIFEERLAERLTDSVDNELTRVNPLGSTAGYRNKREAEDARIGGLGRSGHDLLLDLKMIYGIYGVKGTLVVKIDGVMEQLPRGNELWDKTIVVTAAPVLAGSALSDPTKRMMPNFGFDFADENAIAQWTEDGGATLKRRIEDAIDGAVSAMLVELDLADEALGAYYLGKQALQQKKFEEAEKLLSRALLLDPELVDARATLAVTKAHRNRLNEAIAMTRELAEADPEYAPAQYNLAYWLAVEREDAAAARPFYEKAVALGMPTSKDIEEVLEQ